MAAQPFQINISDSELQLLDQKLATARLPNEHEGYGIGQGVPVSDMKRVIDHWKSSFLPQWKEKHEKNLNTLPMYTLPITTDDFGNLDIHVVHQRSSKPNAIPLLFIHGWPGCFLEATKLLKLLDDSKSTGVFYDVIVPSLPNYGFSDGVKKAGFHLGNYAEACHKVMLALGYPQYVIQGGDWGSMIARTQARMFPKSVKAVHVNLAATDGTSVLKAPTAMLRWLWNWPGSRDLDGIKRGIEYNTVLNHYYLIQQSRPQTVAYCLSDSPVALLGWILEKLIQWADNYPWTDDEICTWISIYWFSKAGPGASVQIYHEAQKGTAKSGGFWEWQPAPLGVTQFPKDIVGMPSFILPTLGNVVFESYADDGGHFAAWERPEKLATDLNKMFGKGGGAYGVVKGKSGKAKL